MNYARTLIAALVVLPMIACGDTVADSPWINVEGTYDMAVESVLEYDAIQCGGGSLYIESGTITLQDDAPDPAVWDTARVSLDMEHRGNDPRCGAVATWTGVYRATLDSISFRWDQGGPVAEHGWWDRGLQTMAVPVQRGSTVYVARWERTEG